MTLANPRAGWEKIGSEFYRKIQLYSNIFDSDLDLENYFCVGAPFSGALALWRDTTKTTRYRTGVTNKIGIDIYSCSGKLISKISWEKGVIKGLGWSEDERLLVIADDGSFHVYFGLHGDFHPYMLGHGADEYG